MSPEQTPQHHDPLPNIRNGVLHEIWELIFRDGGFRGRTWGKRGKNIESPYRGSHILFGSKEGEIVIINIVDGEPVIHEFVLSEGTALGDEIRKLLEKHYQM